MGLSLRTIMPIAAAAGLIAASATSAVAAPAPAHRHATRPGTVHVHGLTTVRGVTLPRTILRHLAARSPVQSPDWGGYAVAADSGKHVRFVSSDFTIPSVNCANSPDGSVVEHWAGLDGFNDNTSEQVGVLAECNSGTPSYLAFYDMVPEPGGVLRREPRRRDQGVGCLHQLRLQPEAHRCHHRCRHQYHAAVPGGLDLRQQVR